MYGEIEEVEELGISIGIYNILDLNPKRFQNILNIRREEEIRKHNENMSMLWQLGVYVGLAVNSPKDYPKSPPIYKEHKPHVQTKEEYLEEWAMFVKANRID